MKMGVALIALCVLSVVNMAMAISAYHEFNEQAKIYHDQLQELRRQRDDCWSRQAAPDLTQ